MSTIWPRLPQVVAESEYAQVRATGPGPPRTRHPAQIYSPVGGLPATAHQIQQLIDGLEKLATAHGYPYAVVDQTPDGTDRRPIIRDVTARLRRKLAFLEVAAIDDNALDDLCRAETTASRAASIARDAMR